MIDGGYIYLWRRIVDSSFYKNPNCAHLAVYLLMAARWQSSDIKILIGGQEQIIQRGQVWVGRYKLAENTGLSSRNVRTCLRTLSTIGFLTSKPTNKGTLVSICKYNDYQNGEIHSTSTLTSNRPATDQQPTSNRPHLNQDKKDNQDNTVGVGGEAPTPGILKLVADIKDCRPEFRVLNSMAIENEIKAVPIEDARRAVADYCKNMINAIAVPNMPLKLLSGYLRKAYDGARPRKPRSKLT